MGKRVRVERDGEQDAPLPVGVTVITHRGRVEFILRSCLLLVLQPVAPVLFAIYISCYAPMTNASVVLPSLCKAAPSRCKKKKEIRTPPPLSAFERRIIQSRKMPKWLHMRFYRFYRKVLCLNTLNYSAIFRSSITFLPFSILYSDISEKRKSISEL